MERESDLLICEIRRAEDASVYEFEVAPPSGPPQTRRFASATELIDQYLRTQTTLVTEGWRPRIGDIAVLE
jgi:hypothetical protein